MENPKAIVDEAVGQLDETLTADQTHAVSRIIEAAVIRGMLGGRHRAVDACRGGGEAEQDLEQFSINRGRFRDRSD